MPFLQDSNHEICFHDKKKRVVPRRGYTSYNVWLFMILVRSEGTYEFMPLNGGSKRKNGLNTQNGLYSTRTIN